MSVEFIVSKLTAFQERLANESSDVGFSFKVSKPWKFTDRKDEVIPYGENKGIYLFTSSHDSDSASVSGVDTEIWYLGKSKTAIGGRVWNHMGRITDPDTNEACNPPFKYHQWTYDGVPKRIQENLSNGEVVIYTIPIDVASHKIDVTEMVEKYLLVEYAINYKRLPVLNNSF